MSCPKSRATLRPREIRKPGFTGRLPGGRFRFGVCRFKYARCQRSGAVEKDLVADSDGCGLLACTDTGYPRLAEKIERLTDARAVNLRGDGSGQDQHHRGHGQGRHYEGIPLIRGLSNLKMPGFHGSRYCLLSVLGGVYKTGPEGAKSRLPD